MAAPYIGVMRQAFTVGADDDDVVTTGTLFLEFDEPEAGDEPIVGDVVLYTVDRGRLAGMFAAARDGATDDDLFLALDAAALGENDYDYDEDDG